MSVSSFTIHHTTTSSEPWRAACRPSTTVRNVCFCMSRVPAADTARLCGDGVGKYICRHITACGVAAWSATVSGPFDRFKHKPGTHQRCGTQNRQAASEAQYHVRGTPRWLPRCGHGAPRPRPRGRVVCNMHAEHQNPTRFARTRPPVAARSSSSVGANAPPRQAVPACGHNHDNTPHRPALG